MLTEQNKAPPTVLRSRKANFSARLVESQRKVKREALTSLGLTQK